MTAALAPFPGPALAPPIASADMVRLGISVRQAALSELSFLLSLHHSFRALEMAPVPWSQAAKDAFLDDQFRLQHAHFVQHHPKADFWVVERALPARPPMPIGRFYLDRSGPLWRVIDIGFTPAARGGGHGLALLAWAQAEARTAGAAGVDLHVMTTNPRARALYLRLGFQDDGALQGYHQHMVWRPTLGSVG